MITIKNENNEIKKNIIAPEFESKRAVAVAASMKIKNVKEKESDSVCNTNGRNTTLTQTS